MASVSTATVSDDVVSVVSRLIRSDIIQRADNPNRMEAAAERKNDQNALYSLWVA